MSHIEIWNPAPGFPCYEVSSLGSVRSTPGGKRIGRQLMQSSNYGYRHVRLFQNGKAHTRLVHRLVCEAFHGPAPTNRHEVAHSNGVRADNRAENLRWATRVENSADKETHGTVMHGQKNGAAKLSTEDAKRIVSEHRRGVPYSVLTGIFLVSKSTIHQVCTGKNWSRTTGVQRHPTYRRRALA